ncbi:uncharacterized protein LACBIDRAFT_331124 [Laccaria bicolor S238N-H82]|uniref:Predicted protein n=1 Tax=Laccaria bicolor (strain S238N-H82 / ATCC MYA-4686) TaxID=486041 RepID=B0DNJ3_LACBS|nr:uncharacterized protein LACBIDRAFT_331124 [Laccaria bicolor S238N-H82]EDR03952.1 predicted protein [Laccaria bicolor S238N-H82]|eukprot:XP_001885520.1 predicted protein [Laccaria bicolor S238N-H82]
MRQLATGPTPNWGNCNRKKDRTMVRFSSVHQLFAVLWTEPLNTTCSQCDVPTDICRIIVFHPIGTCHSTTSYFFTPSVHYAMNEKASFCRNQVCEFRMPKAILSKRRHYALFSTMPTELGCAMDTSGQLKDADDIDWYQSESDSRSLPRLAASTLPAVITALQMVDEVVKGRKWLTILQLRP